MEDCVHLCSAFLNLQQYGTCLNPWMITESGAQYAVGSFMFPTWEMGYLDSSTTSVFTASKPTHFTSQNKAPANRLSSKPCNRDRPETEQEGETCPLCSPERPSLRFHALALLALKSYSNSYRELSGWDIPWIDLPRSNTYRQLSRWDSPWIDLPRRFPQSQGLQH